MNKRCWMLLCCIAALVFPAAAEVEHAIMVRPAQIFLSPDSSSAKLGNIDRGREVAILEKSRNWLHVLASVSQERDITGWIVDKGVVRATTPDGDRVMFGEAARCELEASRRGGRREAAAEARRLYYRTSEYFPNSPLAGEGLYRAADIQWQIDAADVRTRPSSKERDPGLHIPIDEQFMKMVIKKFPGTKWADLASYHLIENKLCGDWEGLSKCPEKESEMYEKYADDHPGSPAAPEALYNAAWRQSTLIEIYKSENKNNKIEGARAKAKALGQRVIEKYPQSDWAYRSKSLIYMIDQQIPTYGNAVE